ncbi:MAG: DNA primase [bacterium]
MKHIDKDTVQRIIQDADVIEIISEFVSLAKAGKEYKGLCPFHAEKTPSFTVNPEKKVFHCFGCGAGGDVLSFLMKYENCSFSEALEFLAKRQGLTLPEGNNDALSGRRCREREIIIRINELAARYYHSLLLAPGIGERAGKYLDSRDISREMREEFCLGYSKESWNDLLLFLKQNKISLQQAARSGLLSSRREGGGAGDFYDRFRGRIIFPICDEYGHMIALGARRIDESSPGPKYLNSPETPAYSKGKCLYGLFQAKHAIRNCGYALVVEGYLDFLSLYQGGMKNTVATLGTALTQDHVKLLSRYTRKVIFIYDADLAGISAMSRGIGIFQGQNVEVKILSLPSGFDPDSFIRQYGPDELTRQVERSVPATRFLIDQSLRKNDISTIEGKAQTVKEIMSILRKISDPFVQMEYIKMAADLLAIQEETLLDEFRRSVRKRSSKGQGLQIISRIQPKAEEIAERVLLGLICRGDIDLKELISASLGPEDFQSARLGEIAEIIFSMWREKGEVSTEELLLALRDEKLKEMVSGFLCLDNSHEDVQRIFHDCVFRLKNRKLMEKLHLLQNEIRSKLHNDPEVNVLLREYSEIKQKLCKS